ncbi:MAG: hypothetical protein U9P44_01285, partial [archaeon]|nr:hypothetical protein [archaeon]
TNPDIETLNLEDDETIGQESSEGDKEGLPSPMPGMMIDTETGEENSTQTDRTNITGNQTDNATDEIGEDSTEPTGTTGNEKYDIKKYIKYALGIIILIGVLLIIYKIYKKEKQY